MTLSLPTQLIIRMHKYLPKGQISKFTTQALMNALNELESKKEAELDAAYKAASKDINREIEAKEWGESDVDNVEGWEWYGET